ACRSIVQSGKGRRPVCGELYNTWTVRRSAGLSKPAFRVDAWIPARRIWHILRRSRMEGGAVSALVFDTFGTVVDWRGSLIAELTAFGGERSIGADWTGLVDAWRAAYAPSMDRVRGGDLPWTK